MKRKTLMGNTVLIILLTCISCQNHQPGNQDEPGFTINIREAIGMTPANLEFEDLFSEHNYLRLENHPDGMIKHIHNVILQDESIFISDRFNLFEFDIHGKFIRQVGAQGKGPGEYLNRIVFSIDTLNQEVIIKDEFKIIFYDLESGRYKREFGFDKDANNFFSFGNDQLVVFTNELSADVLSSSINEVYLLNRDGMVKDTIPNFNRLKIKNNSVGSPKVFYSGNSFKYVYSFNDSIFKLNEDFSKQIYGILSLKNKINYMDMIINPEDIESDKFSDFITTINIIEFNDQLFIKAMKGFNWDFVSFIFNKDTGKTIPIGNFLMSDGEFQFWPSWYSNGFLIDHFYPYEMLDKPDLLTGKNEKLTELIKNMKDDDNPVLVLVK